MTVETQAAAAALSTNGHIDEWLVERARQEGESLDKVHFALTIEIAAELLEQLGDARPLTLRAKDILARYKDRLFAQAISRIRRMRQLADG